MLISALQFKLPSRLGKSAWTSNTLNSLNKSLSIAANRVKHKMKIQDKNKTHLINDSVPDTDTKAEYTSETPTQHEGSRSHSPFKSIKRNYSSIISTEIITFWRKKLRLPSPHLTPAHPSPRPSPNSSWAPPSPPTPPTSRPQVHQDPQPEPPPRQAQPRASPSSFLPPSTAARPNHFCPRLKFRPRGDRHSGPRQPTPGLCTDPGRIQNVSSFFSTYESIG
mmetsp:Transcript_7509/g.8479  ORF Transcript_7509/g.8479 Transcript_7509/m.8479 type:complete len:222 (+) Transcript_7509:74-739(+)